MKARICFRFNGISISQQTELEVSSMDPEDIMTFLTREYD